MANTNCLAGMACPKCKSEGPFKITCTTYATVADKGVIDVLDFQWGDDDNCECVECGHVGGQVKDFRIQGAANDG